MVDQVTLEATERTTLGTRVSRKLRKTGQVPAVIYGHGEAVRAVAVNLHHLTTALQHGARMLTLDVGGSSEQVLIKDVQYDYLGSTIIHADFNRISMDETVTVTVGLRFRGTPKGVEADGGVLTTPLPEIEVECLPGNIPGDIEVSVLELSIGENLTVADITLPEGVVVMTDASAIVASVTFVAEEAEAPAVEAEETAEPEVIGAKDKEEQAEGDDKDKDKSE